LVAAWSDSLPDSFSPQPPNLNHSCRFSTSVDQGITWSIPDIRISPGYTFGWNPTVVSMGENAFRICMSAYFDPVAKTYTKGLLEVSSSSDYGITWGDWTLLTETAPGVVDKPWLISLDNVLYLSYNLDLFTPDVVTSVLVSTSTDGSVWSNTVNVSSLCSDGGPMTIGGFWAQDASDNLYLSFASMANGNVYLTTTTDGKNFTTPIVVTSLAPKLPFTSMAVDPTGEKIAIVSYDAHYFTTVLLSTYSNGEWQDKILSKSGLNAYILLDSDVLHVIWNERDVAHSTARTVYARSKDMGITFDTRYNLWGDYQFNQVAPQQFWTGAYQNLLVDADGNLQAYYINWQNGQSTINRSILKQ